MCNLKIKLVKVGEIQFLTFYGMIANSSDGVQHPVNCLQQFIKFQAESNFTPQTSKKKLVTYEKKKSDKKSRHIYVLTSVQSRS